MVCTSQNVELISRDTQAGPLLSHCLYVSEIYLSKQLTMTTQWQAIDTKAKSLCYFLDESMYLVHLARSAIISYCFNGLDRWQPFFPARLVYTKCIGKVKHEKMLLGWIDSNWAKIPSSNLSYFHQLKQIESIREGSWTNFCDWSFWLV